MPVYTDNLQNNTFNILLFLLNNVYDAPYKVKYTILEHREIDINHLPNIFNIKTIIFNYTGTEIKSIFWRESDILQEMVICSNSGFQMIAKHYSTLNIPVIIKCLTHESGANHYQWVKTI